jgi:type III secretory pathway lipoprotein EscJ
MASALRAIEESRVLRRDLERSTEQTDSFLRSKEERAYTIERETAWGLERTLEQLPGVLEVRVHLSRIGKDPSVFQEESAHDSASVLVIAAPGRSPDETQIRKLVSGAAGVDAEKVIVLVTHAAIAAAANPLPVAVAPVVSAATPFPLRSTVVGSLLGSTRLTKILAVAAGILVGILVLIWIVRREQHRRMAQARSAIRIPPSAAARARNGSAGTAPISRPDQEGVF